MSSLLPYSRFTAIVHLFLVPEQCVDFSILMSGVCNALFPNSVFKCLQKHDVFQLIKHDLALEIHISGILSKLLDYLFQNCGFMMHLCSRSAFLQFYLLHSNAGPDVLPTFQIDSHIRRPVNSAVVKIVLVCLKGTMADVFINC